MKAVGEALGTVANGAPVQFADVAQHPIVTVSWVLHNNETEQEDWEWLGECIAAMVPHS